MDHEQEIFRLRDRVHMLESKMSAVDHLVSELPKIRDQIEEHNRHEAIAEAVAAQIRRDRRFYLGLPAKAVAVLVGVGAIGGFVLQLVRLLGG